MNRISREATHLKGVMFEIHYPPSPFHPRTPVSAPFSGVLNADGQLHAKLDSGTIPGTSATPGIRISGFFAIDADEDRWSFSGYLSNDRISGEAELSSGSAR
jgi:hypothetical protein